MPALWSALSAGMTGLVAKEVFFALLQSFWDPLSRPLQLKGNALDPEILKFISTELCFWASQVISRGPWKEAWIYLSNQHD